MQSLTSFISASHCKTQTCTCHKSAIPCTIFCACECIECQNPHNWKHYEEDEEKEENGVDEAEIEDE